MHLRGSDYWLHPGDYERADLIFQKLMSPVFCKKATHLIAESDYVKRDFQRIQGIPESKISRVYLAPGPDFKRIPDPGRLAEVREKYRLPQEFCLTVTRIMQGKKFYGGKNLYNMLKAFLVSNASREIKFVVVGKRTKAHVQALAGKLPNLQERVIPLDFVPQEDLPGIYNLAKFFLFPSKYESFGVPIAEAMACGCPVVTSSTTACPEIAGNAAILVDPNVLGEITDAIDCLNDHPALREVLSRKGLQRAKTFSWQRAARETLEVIHSL
jgi:glycosyltransferase involved in cell wall biosynthesis